MPDKAPVSVILLTYNEELHIKRCLKSCEFAAEVILVDSYSADRTLEIAKRFNAKIYQHPWETYAKQFNWALETLPLSQPWIMRLDADEIVTPELCDELRRVLAGLPTDVTGLYIKRKVYFMGRWIRHGGYYPTWFLRIWRKGKAKIEERWMDEHVVLFEGRVLKLKNDIEEKNQKSLSWWTDKHKGYALREAKDLLNISTGNQGEGNIRPALLGSQEAQKRWVKEKLYIRMPPFLRAFAYFFYRYFLRLGFLDGKEGLIFHFLQGCWYRFLVDAKIYEARRLGMKEAEKLRGYFDSKPWEPS